MKPVASGYAQIQFLNKIKLKKQLKIQFYKQKVGVI